MGVDVTGDVVSMGLQHYIIICQYSHGVHGVALVKGVSDASCCLTGIGVAGDVVSAAGGVAGACSCGQRYVMGVQMAHLCPNVLAPSLADGRRGEARRKIHGEFHDAHFESHTAAIPSFSNPMPYLHHPWPLKSAHIPEL